MDFPIYFDYAASCPIHPTILDQLNLSLKSNFGNAGSDFHYYGWKADETIQKARMTFQHYFKVKNSNIIFTSGATEANNLALMGSLKKFQKPGHIISSQIEHKAVLEVFFELENQGWEISLIDHDKNGELNLDQLKAAIKENTRLISIMWVNNELGTINPIQEIRKICQNHQIIFHSDFTQGIGKLPLEFPLPDLISLSGHKLYSPKGIGALINVSSIEIQPIWKGGSQEFGLRPGTSPHFLIEAMGKSIELIPQFLNRVNQLSEWNKELVFELKSALGDNITFNSFNSIPHILNFSLKNLDYEKLFLRLNKLAITNGSACNFKTKKPSHVLRALGYPEQDALSSIRLSLGIFTTKEEIEFTKIYLPKIINELYNERVD